MAKHSEPSPVTPPADWQRRFDEAEPLVRSWFQRRNQEALAGSKYKVAYTWVLTNAPLTSTPEQIAFAIMDLLLWFIGLDDHRRDDAGLFFQRVSATLDLKNPGQHETGLLALFEDHVGRLSSLGTPLERYVSERRTVLELYRERNRIVTSGQLPDFEEFLKIRSRTILFRAWYTLWEVTTGFRLSDDRYSRGPFADALAAACTWQVYLNEVHSLSRDREEGMPNLIDCLCHERGISAAEAVDWLKQEMHRLESLTRGLAREHGSTGDHALETAYEFLLRNFDGSRKIYGLELERYQELDR